MDDKTITMQQAADMYNDMFSPDKAENIHDYSLAYAPYPNITGMVNRNRINKFIQSYILTPSAVSRFASAGYNVDFLFLSDGGMQNMVFEFSIAENHPLYDPLISKRNTRFSATLYAIHRKKVNGKMLLCVCKVYDRQNANRKADLFEGYFDVVDSICTEKLKNAYQRVSDLADVIQKVGDVQTFTKVITTIECIQKSTFALDMTVIKDGTFSGPYWERSIYNEDTRNRIREKYNAAKDPNEGKSSELAAQIL